jgi:preprotein translocase subunit SecY
MLTGCDDGPIGHEDGRLSAVDLAGLVAEFQDRASETRSKEETIMPLSRSLARRILLTLALLAVSRIGLYIPLPGLVSTALSPISVFSLGITPYLTAAGLVLLLSGLIRPLRRLRDGTEGERIRFDRAILAGVVVVALLQSHGMAVYIKNALGQLPTVQTISPAAFHLVAMSSMTAGTLLLVWLAHLITRHGIGNGVALLILADLLSRFLPAVAHQIHIAAADDLPWGLGVLLIALFVALVVLLISFLRAKRVIPTIQHSRSPASSPESEPGVAIPLRMNTAGVLPIFAAATIMAFPATLATFGAIPAAAVPQMTSLGYWIVNCVLIIALTYLLTSWIFSGKNTVARLKQFGYSLADVPTGQDPGGYLDRILAQQVALGALLLCGLSALPIALTHWFGLDAQLSALYSSSLLVICAVIAHTFQSARHHWQIDRLGSESDDARRPYTAVAIFETEMEVEMARRLLREAGVDAIGYTADRIIPIAGTVTPWEVCRPTFPSLVIHRRLGGGSAQLLVPEDRLAEAAALLGREIRELSG